MINPVRTICRKRDGVELTGGEIRDLVDGFVDGRVSDAQMAAWAMAVYFSGMTATETAELTQAMLESGIVLTWPADAAPCVDKHSTGGVGDKISLVLAPLLACCGVGVPMISGRGLGPTGGTLDKLESIPGFRTDLSLDEIRKQVGDVGCVITGATPELVPADRKLYALRDVTGTVPSIPLITASIMSKKLAEGLKALVLDVKFGSGAFMKDIASARELAKSLVRVGRACGVPTTALLTDMNQPLGETAGNAIEVEEAAGVLRGELRGPVRELSIALAVAALHTLHGEAVATELHRRVEAALDSGNAWERFRRMIVAQGGPAEFPKFEVAPARTVRAKNSGWIAQIDTEQLGYAVIEAGGGRKSQGQPIDHSVGLRMHVQLGDRVEAGDPLATVFVHASQAESVAELASSAIAITPEPSSPGPLIVETITSADC